MNFKIVRSARKTLCISVSENNEIIVRCPKSVSDERVREFVESKMDWIDKIVYENDLRLSVNSDVLRYEKIYIGGEKYPLVFGNKNKITDEAVYVTDIKKVKHLYIENFSKDFIAYAHSLSNKNKFRVSEFGVKYYKRRWGCCDKKGKIIFNYILFMLPPAVQRYVIIHELCHTVYFNHSAEFWDLVSRFEPNFKNLRRKLKDYDFIINLY